ncbi:MAG: 2-hydroxyacid dehydrogenase, partial [Chakrabartia sp.]
MTVPDRPARPKVIVTRELTDGVMRRMEDLFDAALNREDRGLTRAELEAAVADTDILVPTITDRIDADLLAKASPRLKLIANFGVGVDHIDLHAARERKILVTNTPGVLTEDTADMTMALILSVPRRLGEGEKLIRSGQWDGWKPSGMLGHRVNGKTLGIIGMGRIGRAVAKRAQGFGIRTIYHNRHRLPESIEAELGARFVELDVLFTQSDIVSINCPHTAETHHLV